MIPKNVGGLDRVARIGVGAIFAVVGFSMLLAEGLPMIYGGVIFLIGLIVLTTAATQRCLINKLLGIDTCSRPGNGW